MSEKIILARAPANVAIVKYMGKKDTAENLPANPSVSATLSKLCTVAEVVRVSGPRGGVSFNPEAPVHASAKQLKVPYELQAPTLSEESIQKMTRHVERVRNTAMEILPHYGVSLLPNLATEGTFRVRAANTFPSDAGVASSASSFAAVTLATAMACAADPAAFEKAWSKEVGLRRAFARVSRKGSGSSCRSFEGPWVYWDADSAEMITDVPPAMKLSHFLIVVSTEPKKVSSSQAHERVKSSPLWDGRPSRAGMRATELRLALKAGNLKQVSKIAWAETWEMHSLFHTSAEPFSYFAPGTIAALNWLAPRLKNPGDETPPIVTLDAGPNVHILVPTAQASQWKKALTDQFASGSKGAPTYKILEDELGEGAQPVGVK